MTVLFWILAVYAALLLLFFGPFVIGYLRRGPDDTYPPEAAEAPDPVDEHQASTVRDQTFTELEALWALDPYERKPQP